MKPGAGGSGGSQQQPQPRRSHPFSSVSLSPDSRHAVAAGKDVLHVLRLHLDGGGGDDGASSSSGLFGSGHRGGGLGRLEEVRSVRISQHFQSAIQTTNAAAAAAGGQNPQYPHLRDALRLPGSGVAPGSAPLPAASAGGGISIDVTDVAWSLPQSYVVDGGLGLLDNKSGSVSRDGHSTPGSGHRGSDNAGSLVDSYEELLVPDPNDLEQHSSNHDRHYPPFVKRIYSDRGEHSLDDTSVVAAAGSNGVIAAWSAHSLLTSPTPTAGSPGGGGPAGLFHARKNVGSRSQHAPPAGASIGQPEAAFLAHSRAVNRLAWHPTGRRPYLLLTASQDGTVKLWDRRASSSSSSATTAAAGGAASTVPSTFNLNAKSWFKTSFGGAPAVRNARAPPSTISRTAIWHCVSTYQPKCEAVRDVKWNPFMDDVYAMVAGEWLCVYDIRINRPLVKESTHAGDATSVDWHPTQRYTLATGGGRDRSVKVWGLESSLNIHKQEDDASMSYIKGNAGSFGSDKSETMSTTSHSSSEGAITSPPSNETTGGRNSQVNSTLNSHSNLSTGSASPVKRSASGVGFSHHSRHHKKKPLHVLNIAAPVTRIRWRPPEDESSRHGRNDSMIAVATSSIYGANAGGNGSIALWSVGRPFMPVSVCEGHLEGAVTDFAWAPMTSGGNRLKSHGIDHMSQPQLLGNISSGQNAKPSPNLSTDSYSNRDRKAKYSREKTADVNVNPGALQRIGEEEKQSTNVESAARWETILTVGRDGQCLLQKFSLGDKPILDVSPSVFAMAPLSAFQPGFGSLQIMAVHQHMNAPEILSLARGEGAEHTAEKENSAPHRISRPELVFSITDEGHAEDLSKASLAGSVGIAPELTHLSRFSELYETSIGNTLATRADVCRHNATVAAGLSQKPIAQMWRTLATMLDGSGLDSLPASASDSHSSPMAYLLYPTLRNLLLQRADAGDVQTCVVLCEVMDVVVPPSAAGGSAKSRIPNLSITLIRVWYLTYIDLLQQMCLFTQAATTIRNCRDPVVGALNQQSTTVGIESCPRCGKPLLGATTVQDDSTTSPQLSAQRICRSCRSRVGFCFICHEPVKSVFVFCPGCGHGGCLDHALEWFSMNEVCPTGCGHKCNLIRTPSKF